MEKNLKILLRKVLYRNKTDKFCNYNMKKSGKLFYHSFFR